MTETTAVLESTGPEGQTNLSNRVMHLEALLRRAHQDLDVLRRENLRLASVVQVGDGDQGDLRQLTRSLARANAEAAEFLAELEQKNEALVESNAELARANAYAAELMATLGLKDEEISRLNQHLSRANVRAAQLLAEREVQLDELARVNRRLSDEISERRAAQAALSKAAQDLLEANARLDRLSTLDPRTELLNRRGFERSLREELNRVQRSGELLGILFIDVDNFKAVNDNYGHDVGDLVLKEISVRLTAALRVSDTLGRMGGDEFIVLAPIHSLEKLRMVADRVVESVGLSEVVRGTLRLSVSVSVGACLLPSDSSDVEQLLKRIRLALKTSKSAGKNRATLLEDLEAENTEES